MHTLLLADDSLTIQRVIELTFADEDIRVITVSTGEQAIAAMEEGAPDIVLADVGMPGKSGYEIARYVRETPRLARTRVLLLAGAFDPADSSEAAAREYDGVLVKPFEPQQVIARVRELLSPSGVIDAATVPVPKASQRASGNLDDYFEQLDRALGGPSASVGNGLGTPPVASPGLASGSAMPRQEERARPPVPLPSLPAAFAALLAAEESSTNDPPLDWPETAQFSADRLVEQVTERVLARLSDSVVRTTVTDIVSAAAERLVKEEIARIKASIDQTVDE